MNNRRWINKREMAKKGEGGKKEKMDEKRGRLGNQSEMDESESDESKRVMDKSKRG